MSKRFVVVTGQLSPDQEEAFRASLGGIGWWHWMGHAWLITDLAELHSAGSIRDAVRAVNDRAEVLVLEVSPKDWASAFFTNEFRAGKEHWLNTQWELNPHDNRNEG